MSITQYIAEANIGKIARQNDRLIAQNERIIELLAEQNRALQYLAETRSVEVTGR